MLHSHPSRRPATLTAAVFLALLVTLPASAEVTREHHSTVPLSANGRVSVENINGDVEITGWSRNEVQIDAVISAPDQQRLGDITILVGNNSNAVNIETKYAHHFVNNNPGSVHYTLHVPQNATIDKINLVNGSLDVQKVYGEVNANLVNGKLRATDLAGTADLQTVNGTIDANYNSLKDVHSITLKSVNGAVNLLLPPSANANVSASNVSGGISTDFPLTVKGEFGTKSLSGTLGNGGVEIELNNVNGSIHIGPGRGTL